MMNSLKRSWTLWKTSYEEEEEEEEDKEDKEEELLEDEDPFSCV